MNLDSINASQVISDPKAKPNPELPEGSSGYEGAEQNPNSPKTKSSSQNGFLNAITDWIKFLFTRPGFPTLALLITLLFLFQHLFEVLPEYWFVSESYYSHGPLVPFLVAYIIWDRKDLISKTSPPNPKIANIISWIAFALLLPMAYVVYISSVTDLLTILSLGFVTAFILGSLILFDYNKVWVAMPGLLYLFLAFPFGRGRLDYWTGYLQHFSTSGSFHILEWVGAQPLQVNANQIAVNDYTLYVAAACAGMGLSVSVVAFALLFIIIGRLKLIPSIIMLAASLIVVIPVNAFRIALIAMVGGKYGDAAAASFHDWSGYIALAILFFILMKLTRLLGWK